jgi:opacity protein-like surface antigen
MILMKTFAITLAAGLLAATTVFAQTPTRTAPAAAPAAAASPLRGLYVGASVDFGGASLDTARGWGNSLTVGYDVTRNIAVEAVLSQNYGTGAQNDGQTGFVNAVVGMPVGPITPYALVGVGAGIGGAGNADKDAEGLWNVGAGVTYNITRNWQLDARYRYVDAIAATRDAEQAVSLGVNYKF